MQKSLTKRNTQAVIQSPPTPMILLEQAMSKDLDLDRMQKLMDMQEQWEKKEAKKAFMDALSRFQTLVPVIPKKSIAKIQSQKGAYSYRFANLGTISAAIKEALNLCGLSYRWEFQEANGKLKVTCLLSHRDGHTETTLMEAGMDATGGKNDIQQKGSTQTYLQRYTLIGALGLSTADEDVDGAGSPTTHKQQTQQQEQTDEEYLYQWQQVIDNANSRIELRALYLQNKKAVDGNAKVKEMFNQRREQLPEVNKTTMP
jgi:hypothetical protein